MPRPSDAILTGTNAAALWTELDGTDGAKARAAVDWLARNPDVAMRLLTARFQARIDRAAADASQLIRDLDGPEFATREKATDALRGLGLKAKPALVEALPKAPPEMKRRIAGLLDSLDKSLRLPLSGEAVRGVRVIEILERIRTAKAKELLTAWAGQSSDPRLAAEAPALDRLTLPAGCS